MINHRTLFLNHLAQTSDAPLSLHIIKAQGSILTDADGKDYIDLVSGIAVSNIGHNHPSVISAIKKQVDDYMHIMVYGELIQSPQTLLAQKLATLLPENLSCCYFVNSGAEAVDGAMKLAKRFTKRREIIAFENSYHGSTQGPLSLMSNEYFTSAFRPLLPGINFIRFNAKEDLEKITSDTVCVIAELIKAENGCNTGDKDYFKDLRKRCTQTGTLLVLDESQTAFGRTGSMFAFEQYGIVPDILILSKSFGGGMPLGAFIASKEIMQTLSNNPVLGHITTFGGHPVCCAASLASMEVLVEEKIIDAVFKKEKLFRSHLKNDTIKNISGSGLLLAIEFENAEINKKIIQQCLANGLFTDWFLFAENCMRIAPPLNISDELIVKACALINKSIEEIRV